MDRGAIDRRALPAGAIISYWQAPDGWRLRRLDWPQEPGEATRGSLIFAGGRGDFIEKYLEAIGHWHARGWNILSFDWRGQGHSRGDVRGGNVRSFDPLVADGAKLIEEWIGGSPGPHVAISHSLGAHLLLRILAEHRPPVTAAVLIAPMIAINTRPTPARAAPVIARLMALLGGADRPVWKPRPGSATGRIRQANLTTCPERYADESWWKAQEPGFDLGSPSWGWMNAAFRSMASLSDSRLASIKTPILLLGTERDRLVSPDAIRRAASILPEADLLMFDKAAHELLRESDPVRLAAFAKIDDFLDLHAPQ